MGRRRYALEPGLPKALELRWSFRFRQVRISLEERELWTVDRAAILQGVTLVLPDGSSLFVRRVKRKWYTVGLRDELRVERDGVPVPGSDGHPRVIGRRAASVILLLAFVRVLLLVPLSQGVDAPFSGGSIYLVAELVAVAALGVLSAFGVRVAVAIAAGLFALETLVAFAFGVSAPLVQALVAANLFLAWRRMKPAVPVPNLRQIFE